MDKMKKWVLIKNGLVISAIAMLLSLQSTVIAKSNEQAIMGEDSEDPYGDAFHPANDAHAAIVVCVATKYNSQTSTNNIRFCYSANNGTSWQGYEWIASGYNEQDYSDVHCIAEQTYLRIIAVWQERVDENSPWQIKASTRLYNSGNWNSPAIDISDTEDLNDNIYPKIDTYRTLMDEQLRFYWNIVWQREDDDNNWQIKMYTRYYTSGSPTEYINDIMSGSQSSYRHPAVACTGISGGDCEVHITYDAYFSSTHYVYVISGWVSTNSVFTQYNFGPRSLDSDSTDSEIGYPDITSSGNGGGSGHPSQSTGSAHVWIVWHHVLATDRIYRVSSTDSLGSDPVSSKTIVSTSGPSTSAALRCVAVAILESTTSPITIIWTDDTDIYFVKSTNWNNVEQWTSTEATDKHVDVSVIEDDRIYSHVVWQRDEQTIYYARDP